MKQTKNNQNSTVMLASLLRICVIVMSFQTVGCDFVQDINRVNNNYVDKTMFEGEWFYRASIVDKQFNQASSFIGSECDLDRVRFEITENMLRAYRSYEKVPGSEGANHGQQTLVAAFPILKHFDIKREYNSQTGVENNVIIENDFDRPWWERQHIRVDWSSNMAPDVQCNDWIKTEAIQQIPRNSAETPRDPYRVRLSSDYLETTIEALARPQESVCSYIGDWNCDGSRVKIKFAFRKITPSDYEKQLYPDYKSLEYGKTEKGDLCVRGDEGCKDFQELWLSYGPAGAELCDPSRHNIDDCVQYEVPVFSRFGYFRTERQRFDRENGFTLSGREQYINRWNIWESTHRSDGTLIPESERVPKAIVYYLNVQFPMDLFETTQLMAENWNVAFSETLAKTKSSCTLASYNKYVDTKGLKREMSSHGFGVATEANLKAACVKLGEVSTAKQLNPVFFNGDYKQINDVYGKMFQIRINDCNLHNATAFAKENDLEKELVDNGISAITSGNLEEACAVLEYVSERKGLEHPFHWQRLGDLRYSFLNYTNKAELAGPLGYGPSAADPLSGEIINANANIYGPSLDTYAAWGADIVQLLNGEISDADVMNGTQIRKHIDDTRRRYAQKLPDETVFKFGKLFDDRTAGIRDREYLKRLPLTSLGENLNVLRQSGFEDQYLLSDEMVQLFAQNGTQGAMGKASDRVLDRIRPSSWMKPIMPPAELLFGRNQMDGINKDRFSSFESEMLSQFGHKVEFFGRRNACFLAETVEPAIADLAASLAGKSWEQAYQIIRANIFMGVGLHEIGHTLGLRHNFEASADAINYFPAFWGVDTGDHRMSKNTNRSTEMRYSSIMDYHQRFNSDFAGIGLYDKAAIKFGYGGLIEVFDESDSKFVPRDWHNNADMFHYRDLPYLYAGEDVDGKLNVHYDSVRDKYRLGDEKARVDIKSLAIAPHPENLFKRKDVPFAVYYKDLVFRLFGQASAEGGLFEVPYKYCSDSYAWGGNITCNLWDMGASAEEIVANAAEMYEAYYPFNSFRGDKIYFSPSSYMSRLYGRTYQPMLNAFRYLYYYRRSSLRIWPLMQDWTAAAYKGVNFFGRVLQTVEPGRYCLTSDNLYVPEKDVESCQNPIDIELGQGRYYDTSFTQDFFFKPNNVGHMYDKLLAMQALTDSAAFFTRDFTASFSRGAFSIGYYRVFAPEMIQLFSSLLQGDAGSYSPELILDQEQPTIRYRPIVPVGDEQPGNLNPRIQSSSSWIMRYYALVLPMINYTSTVDRQLDYAKRARITLVGSKHDPVVDPSIKQVVFTDPSTKLQYRALAPEGEELAPGYQLLKEAQSFVSDGANGSTVGPWRRAKKAVDDAKARLGQASASGDSVSIKNAKEAVDNAQAELRSKNTELYQRAQVIDLMRYLGDMLDYGA